MSKLQSMQFDYSEFSNSSEGFRRYCIAIIDLSFQIYQNRLKNIIEEYSEANVHGFRVSSRRFISALNMVYHFFPSPYIKRISKSAKKHLKRLSRLRDIQVMSMSAMKLKIQFPIIFEFISYLGQMEYEQIKSNKEYFSNIQFWEINDDFFHLIRSLKYELKEYQPTFDDLKTYILQEYFLLLEQKKLVNIEITETIHKLRLKNKKFRYLIETTQPIFKNAKKITKILSTQQNKMGAIQDVSVFLKEIQSYLLERSHLTEEFSPIIKYLLNHQKNLSVNFEKTSVILNNLIYFDLNEN